MSEDSAFEKLQRIVKEKKMQKIANHEKTQKLEEKNVAKVFTRQQKV
jgi:hypothetical protein